MPDSTGEEIDAYIAGLFLPEDAALRAALESARGAGPPGI